MILIKRDICTLSAPFLIGQKGLKTVAVQWLSANQFSRRTIVFMPGCHPSGYNKFPDFSLTTNQLTLTLQDESLEIRPQKAADSKFF